MSQGLFGVVRGDGTRRATSARFIPIGAALLLALAGCTTSAPSSQPAASGSAPAAVGSAAPAPTAAPTLAPEGDAAANLAYFDSVNERLLAETPSPKGRAVIDNLVAAGFSKADMEVTPDTTSAGVAADNIQFAVRINNSCLVGQVGNAGYAGVATPVLGTGKCLVGVTRAIDW